jgi:AraC-like DNA-binding protein
MRDASDRDAAALAWFRSLAIVIQEAAPLVSEQANAARERTPPTRIAADARLRSWLIYAYGGYDGPSVPHAPVALPATLVTELVLDVSCSPSRPPAFVNGPSGTYTRVEGPCAAAITVGLAPLAAYKLLGPAVSEIGGSIVGLEDIVGDDARRLSEQIRSVRTWNERGKLLDDLLLSRATHGPQPSPEVSHAWHLLVRCGGNSTISEIAREVGWSHKHLITRFKQQIGVAPHMAARLVRLFMVWRHLDDEQSWAHIAAECGYADQAHLIREFRRFTGTTPGALVTT